MNEITVLVTAVGASITEGTVYSLKNNPDNRKVRVIGVDSEESVAGKYLCDEFYQVPKELDDSYVSALEEICKRRNVSVLLPIMSDELMLLAQNRGRFEMHNVGVALSNTKSLMIANDKFELIQASKRIGIPCPESYLVSSLPDLRAKSKILGYPENPVVVRQPVGSGERGFRIIRSLSEEKRKDDFYRSKPHSSTLTLEELSSILGDSFPPLIVSEFLPGKEYTVDCFRNSRINIAIPRTRDFVKLGVSFEGTLEKNDEIIGYSKKLAEALDLEYCFGFQFKLDRTGVPKLLECNPRVQGATVASTFGGANLTYASVKQALLEPIPEMNIKWGSKILRYFGTIGIDNKGNAESATKGIFDSK